MAAERKFSTKTICINQLVRPKTKIPRWMRQEDCGDCTECQPCEENKKCVCYTPVALMSQKENKQ